MNSTSLKKKPFERRVLVTPTRVPGKALPAQLEPTAHHSTHHCGRDNAVLSLASPAFCAHRQSPSQRATCEREMNSQKETWVLQGGRDAGREKWQGHQRESSHSAVPKRVPPQCTLLPSDFTLLLLHPQLQSGIGRLILKEEMKARSSSYADPWTPPRSSTSSREALHTAGYDMSLNGCKRRWVGAFTSLLRQ